jgi:hypothetical protein
MIADTEIDASGIVGGYFDSRQMTRLYSSHLRFPGFGGTISFPARFRPSRFSPMLESMHRSRP